MPQTTCPTCGAPVHRSDALTDAGAEVYCSEACAEKPASVHTPTPWTLTEYLHVVGPNGEDVMVDEGHGYGWVANPGPDAAFVVRAVNAYDALVAALEAVPIVRLGETLDEFRERFSKWYRESRNVVLAAARGTK